MKILIVEDNDVKRNEIIELLCNANITLKKDFKECKSINSAKETLRKEKFDILLLDLNLPLRDDSESIPKKGLELLKDFKYDVRYSQPKEIISITAYEEELVEVKEEFEQNLIHIIHYHPIKDEWKKKLIERLEYLKSSEKENYTYKYDLAILCALEDPELSAVKKLTKNLTRHFEVSTNIPFYSGVFDFGEKKLNVLITSMNRMGMVATAVLSTQIIELFRPKFLCMTGIAAGIEGEVKLGDILVINPSWDSGSGKVKKDNEGNKLFEIDPKQETINIDILGNIHELSNDKIFLNKLREEWDTQDIDNVLKVHIGPVASGAAVIANQDITDQIKLQSRKIIGIEMEAYGLIYAAKNATNPKPEPLVIKSVCDFANENKHDGFQKYASYTSANFLYEYARRYIEPI